MDAVDDALYCPTCSYNLTGLLENRCPECGNTFDPDAIRKAQHENAIKPIGVGEAVFSLMAFPAVFLIMQGLTIATAGAALPFLLIGGVVWLIGSLFLARSLAKRLAVTNGRWDVQGKTIHSPWFVPCCTIGLFFVQIAIGAGPCAVMAISG